MEVLNLEDGWSGDVVEAARGLTSRHGRGADVVIEAVATAGDVGVGGGYGAEGWSGELLWGASGGDGGWAGYESAALWGDYVEGEFSSHAGVLPDGVRVDYEWEVQGGGDDYAAGRGWGRCRRCLRG